MTLSRRRFLTISAAGALVPAAAKAKRSLHRTGRALGASTSMQFVNMTEAEAEAAYGAVEAELARLERIFSLFDPASQLCALNKIGHLRDPAPELLEVLSLCGNLHYATGGVFDPTIQPLWVHHAGLARHAPPQDLVGWEGVSIESHEIRLKKVGMQLTLNGVAQGYITDRIAALLRARGLRQVLINMGEIAAIGENETQPWAVGVASPAGQIVARLQLTDRALATSAPRNMILNPDLNTSHILDPFGRVPTTQNELVSISSPSAALADGLSTAGCLMSKEQLLTVLARYPSTNLEVLH